MSLFPEEPLDSAVGYFPGHLNQIINNGRWTLIRKLGWGSRSSCWLATDSEDPENIRAIKIYSASASKDSSSANERNILQKLRDSGILSNVPVTGDTFYEETEGRTHFCLVLHVLGPSILSLLDDSTESERYLPLHAVKQVVGAVLGVLCLLHKNNIIHGAVTPDNVLLPSFQQAHSIRDFMSNDPSNFGQNFAGREGRAYHVVKSQPMNTYGLKRDSPATDFASIQLDLSNYSHARIVSENTMLDAQSNFLPPEASIEGASIDTKADIWMLGCTIYTLLTGRELFENAPGMLSPEDFEKVLAAIRPDLSATKAMSRDDAKETASIIKVCLRLDPTDRPTASRLLGYRWVQSGMICSCGWCASNP
ncbi:hypothetical protein M413DRAFT_166345 [Hebeloma cylindrosporum]|uniref:non-specific serine/threonine protein kinase n=1 Tax=Hebeloma cylindrosporum TaxID=76867 RepID=A0A0C3BVQ0_HEBCY|nr:hypothetical protein M413DRAFT_166345 [Hebeloma cylindrosporum h7]